MMVTKNVQYLNPKFCCKKCDFFTSDKQDFKRHKLTRKHLLQRNGNKNGNNGNNACFFSCNICKKTYKHRSGLSRHKKKCKFGEKKSVENSSFFTAFTEKTVNVQKNVQNLEEKKEELSKDELIKILLKQNQEHQKKIDKYIENQSNMTNKIVEALPNLGNTTNNTQNNNISINVYLNEHCKNAMNLTDFVKQLQISVEDLIYQGEHGYVKGIENIFTKQLQDLPPTERPIHCSDKKRMQFYVKDDNKWQKDPDHEKIDKTLTDLTVKGIKTLKEWEAEHPNYMNNDSEIKIWQNLVAKITGPVWASKEGKKTRGEIKKGLANNTNMKEAIKELKKDT